VFSRAGRNSAGIAVLLAVVCILPFIVRPYQLDFLVFMFINIILVVSYRLIAITGEFSLSHAVIMGVGGYASALLTLHLPISAWISMPLGGVAAALIAYILSFPLFRMKGFYFLIGSFAAAEAIRLCWVQFINPFGGYRGLRQIPVLEIDLGDFLYIDLGAPVPYYFFALIVGLIFLVIMYRIEHSRFGFVFHAVHHKDMLAQSVGVNARRYRTIAFVTGGFFAGIAGAMVAHYITAINPGLFGLKQMLFILVWVLVGGLGSFAGPILGVVVLSIIDESIRGLNELRPAFYGLILIITMLFLPDGLVSLPDKVMQGVNWLRKREDGDAPNRE
jgi:branched-chain amino acid transport system permease protein